MILLTKEQKETLLDNGRVNEALRNDGREEIDFQPVVKLFMPDAGATWLLTELNPDEPDIAFGLCDLGLGFPEIGCVSLEEIESVRGRLGLPVERDRSFKANRPLSAYADDARRNQRIIA